MQNVLIGHFNDVLMFGYLSLYRYLFGRLVGNLNVGNIWKLSGIYPTFLYQILQRHYISYSTSHLRTSSQRTKTR